MPERSIRERITMNRISQALYFGKEAALYTSKFLFTVAKGLGRCVAAVPGYVAHWSNEYTMKRQRALDGNSTSTRSSSTFRRRSRSPQEGRAFNSRIPVVSKKAKEAQERRMTRIVSRSLHPKTRSSSERRGLAPREESSLSTSSPAALGSSHRTASAEYNEGTPHNMEHRYSISSDFSGEAFKPGLTSTPVIFSSSPDRGTPPFSESTIEDLTASMPGALITHNPESPTLLHSNGRSRIKLKKSLGGRRATSNLRYASTGECPEYENDTKRYPVPSDKKRRPLTLIDKNALVGGNNLMGQLRAPKGVRIVKIPRKESSAMSDKKTCQARGKSKEMKRIKMKDKDDPRLQKFERALARSVQVAERRRFAELEIVPLAVAPLTASPEVEQQQQQPLRQFQEAQEHVQDQQLEQEDSAVVTEAVQEAVGPEDLPQVQEEQQAEESAAETIPTPQAEPINSVPGSPQQVESQELSHLEDAPPPRTPKRVHWNTTAFTSPQVIPKIKYYIKDEKMSYPSNERLAPEYRNPHTPQPQIPDDFSVLNDEESLWGTPLLNAFNKYDTPEPVEGETSELEAIRRGFSDFHVSTRYRDARDRRKQEIEEERKKEEAERKAVEEKIKAAAEAEKEKKRQAKRKAEEAARAKKAAEAEAAAAAAAKKKIVRPLSAEADLKVSKAMATQNKSSVLAQARGVELSRKDFGTVLPQSNARDGIGWLNDEIVNAYVGAAVDRQLEKIGFDRKKMGGQAPPLHAFNTNWYNTISSKGVQAVARWSKRAKLEGAKLLEVEQILFPINDGNHWTLLSVSGTKKQIWYLDSLGGKGKKYLETAKEWLKMELKEKYVADDWEVVGGGDERKRGIDWTSPRQDNGVDCGVFTCFNALAVVRGVVPSEAYSSQDMLDARKQVVGTLLEGGFSGEFDWA